jgi:hypothetical protein
LSVTMVSSFINGSLTPDQVKFGAPGLGSAPDGVSDPTGRRRGSDGLSKRLRRRGRRGKRREQAWLM